MEWWGWLLIVVGLLALDDIAKRLKRIQATLDGNKRTLDSIYTELLNLNCSTKDDP